MSRPIPVGAAETMAQRFGCRQIIILGWGDDGVTRIATWGQTKKDCDQAAAGSKRLAEFMGLVPYDDNSDTHSSS